VSKNRFQELSNALKGQNLPEQVEEIVREVGQLSPPSPKRGGKRSDPNFIQVGVYVPKDLHIRVKKLLLDQPDMDMSDLVAELLQNWVEEQGG
jgi:hypothetical protein